MSEGRDKRLEAIRSDGRFDVVVVGGGVNGIGAYRDLALQGLRVLLIERSDFCSGCSAAPSRMIHGGLRYLENGEFDLVRESLEERDALLLNAPHMVRPLPTVIPITSMFSGMLNSAASFFGWHGKPSNRGAIPIKLGLSLYDWVTRSRRILPRHQFFNRNETRRRWPAITPDANRSAVYFDAWINYPERLCIEMIRDVEKVSPQSVALNYAEMTLEDGVYRITGREVGPGLTVTPQTVVNATGAWLDASAKLLGNPDERRMVSGTKGSHLIIQNDDLLSALDGHMVYFENADGRVCILFPYLGNVLAGATDIRVQETTRVRCEDDELAYILNSLAQVFPGIPVDRDQVVFSFSGIRPLPESDQHFTGRISRGHEVRKLDGPVPQFALIGGKWTTFRALAEQATEQVLAELGRSRDVSTRDIPIGGGLDFPSDAGGLVERLVEDFDVPGGRAEHLSDHYGTSAVRMLEEAVIPRGDTPIASGSAYTEGEIRHVIRTEYVETLSDVVLRRTALAISGQVSMQVIDSITEILAAELGIARERIEAQKAALIEELKEFHGVTPEMLKERSMKRSLECV